MCCSSYQSHGRGSAHLLMRSKASCPNLLKERLRRDRSLRCLLNIRWILAAASSCGAELQ